MGTATLDGEERGEPTIETELHEDEVFDVLSNERRRYVYRYLDEQPDELVSLRELVDHVAACEYGKPARELTSDERNRVSTALNQFHLPKMDECGFVEFDSLRKEATLTEDARDLNVYLDVVPGPDVPWAVYYVGLGGLHAVLLGGVLLGAPGLSLVPSEGWLVFVVATLVASALAHLWYTYRGRLVDDETLSGRLPGE
jgi:hypothetical protein